MKLSSFQLNASKVALALLGATGMHLLLKDFGYARIWQDLTGLGWAFVPIVLCYLLPFSLLALSWWVLIQGYRVSFPYAFLVSLVANAWNNIGPVAKSLGEPTRVLLLSDRMPVRQALRGMMLFNITQAMGTAITFGLGAALAPLLFDLSDGAFWITIASSAVALLLSLIVAYWMLSRPSGRRPATKGRAFRAFFHWMRWLAHQIRRYARNHPRRYFLSVALAASARLSEGLIFFSIFTALGTPLTFLESVAVDIGRGVADNAFFFVPYQLGTRELSLVFVTESVLRKGSEAAMAASLVFRLGELCWILCGFLLGLWMLKRRTA